MNITVLETDGYEADDIIGTFAVHAPQNAEIIIVTGDKDELQLLDDRVKVYFTKRGFLISRRMMLQHLPLIMKGCRQNS